MKYGNWFTNKDIEETNYKILIEGKNAYINTLENKVEKYRNEAVYLAEQNEKLQETIRLYSKEIEELKKKSFKDITTEYEFDIENIDVIGIEFQNGYILISYYDLQKQYQEWHSRSTIENYNKILKRFRYKIHN